MRKNYGIYRDDEGDFQVRPVSNPEVAEDIDTTSPSAGQTILINDDPYAGLSDLDISTRSPRRHR